MKELDFLAFKDFVESKEHLNKDWITVARFNINCDSYGTFSALLPNIKKVVQKILSNSEWDINTDVGKLFFRKSFKTGKIKLDPGVQFIYDGIPARPFTILRDFHGAFPSSVDITQSFFLYHGLYFDAQNRCYIDPITEEEAIRYIDPEYVWVRTTYLRDYLAATKMILVRYHDCSRSVKKDPLTVLGKEKAQFNIKDNSRNFSIFVGKSVLNTRETSSRLLGKDIVLPFSEPRNPDYLNLIGKADKKYVAFIIGIDQNGKNIEETCNEEELSNFFANKGKAPFLTLTYFKKEVLQKYYQNPRRYTVSPGYIQFLDIWGIPFDVNDAELVHVWLGDLGRIPYEEQLHFRQYNVLPSGGISEDFFQTQLMATFVEKKEPISDFKKLFDEVNTLFEQKSGFKIFRGLSSQDSHVYKTIHVPLTNEAKELEEQLIYLSKILVDSINKSELKKRVKWKPSLEGEDTHIRYLEEYLKENFEIDRTKVNQIVQPFRTAQRLRSQSAAHRKSTEFRKALEKLGLNNKKPQETFEVIVSALTSSLEAIKKLINK